MISLTQPVNQCPIKNSILFVDSYGSHNSLLFTPSEKYFENALKFKSLPQNNGISAELLKQKL
jgi:hypothetical protein